MNESANSPSMLGSFLKGAGSGALNGGIMATIMTAVTYTAGYLTIIAPVALAGILPGMALLVAGTGIFGGVMAVKRSLETKSDVREFTAPSRPSAAEEMTPAVAMSQTMPAPALAEEAEMASAPTRSWTDRTDASRANSIRQILDNGAMGDKDRAAAILAARESAANQGPTI